jgi:hypothetical protein
MHQNDSSDLHLIELPKASWVTWGLPPGQTLLVLVRIA